MGWRSPLSSEYKGHHLLWWLCLPSPRDPTSLFITSAADETETKVESTDSLMSQWNLKIQNNNCISQTAAHMCVCLFVRVGAHTEASAKSRVFFPLFIFSHHAGLVYTGLLHHLHALTERDGLCGKRMEVWWIHNFSFLCRPLCEWGHTVHMYNVWQCTLLLCGTSCWHTNVSTLAQGGACNMYNLP